MNRGPLSSELRRRGGFVCRTHLLVALDQAADAFLDLGEIRQCGVDPLE
jgi:hypothetical protein